MDISHKQKNKNKIANTERRKQTFAIINSLT